MPCATEMPCCGAGTGCRNCDYGSDSVLGAQRNAPVGVFPVDGTAAVSSPDGVGVSALCAAKPACLDQQHSGMPRLVLWLGEGYGTLADVLRQGIASDCAWDQQCPTYVVRLESTSKAIKGCRCAGTTNYKLYHRVYTRVYYTRLNKVYFPESNGRVDRSDRCTRGYHPDSTPHIWPQMLTVKVRLSPHLLSPSPRAHTRCPDHHLTTSWAGTHPPLSKSGLTHLRSRPRATIPAARPHLERLGERVLMFEVLGVQHRQPRFAVHDHAAPLGEPRSRRHCLCCRGDECRKAMGACQPSP